MTFEAIFPTAYQLYREDVAFFRDLGVSLTEPADYDHGEWHAIATITTEQITTFMAGTTVVVEVCMMPAQFWRFTITSEDEDVQDGVLSTGSGTFQGYWPTVSDWAGGGLDFAPADREDQ